MPYNSKTAKAAVDKHLEDKNDRYDAMCDKLEDARHMQQLYACKGSELREAFNVETSNRRNYSIPCVSNLKPSKQKKKKKKKKTCQNNRGRQMLQAALAKIDQ
eukprot:511139_1